MKNKVIVSALAFALFITTLTGCGGRDPDVCGGKVDNSYNAPKSIKSSEIVSFSTRFYRYCLGDASQYDGNFFVFKIKKDKNGDISLSETETLNITCKADESLLKGVYEIIKDNNLFKLNGTDCYTAGLPPEYQPMFLEASFASKEKLYFREDGNPDEAWCYELSRLFADCFEKSGDSSLFEMIFGNKKDLNAEDFTELSFRETGMMSGKWMVINRYSDEYVCYTAIDENHENPNQSFVVPLELGDAFITAVIEKDVYKWNGFSISKSLGKDVLDGDKGFSFSMSFEQDGLISANGYNSFPESYTEIKGLIEDFFEENLRL